jgi:hypothetical protein
MPMFGRQSPEHEGARLPRRRLSLYAAGTRAHEVKNHFVASGITEHECTDRPLIEKLPTHSDADSRTSHTWTRIRRRTRRTVASSAVVTPCISPDETTEGTGIHMSILADQRAFSMATSPGAGARQEGQHRAAGGGCESLRPDAIPGLARGVAQPWRGCNFHHRAAASG